ncbi:NADH-quinone oxidoreductase subunit NuoE [Micromonospora craniellae]|uniref:NADH-quinone oxidoreductase subunit NuoE n=1 Tax=Micromonospora craniellae TaxID=2294034 RepID=A0A372FV98_9ACTN|nr:NADH-quinone oxidoreductase subunit NuoE [Micromonospora craniellae]QOC94100.1 NADH-quinone oxidoreductase subunit NuoE [Micromonospora craniellae]RFS44717.1 NADH-quinone oxidoreductase subunit NuoE [Micromonospora craniellae]
MSTTVFTDQTRARAREIIARYPADRSRSALLPLLHLVQSEEGYVSPAGVAFCAEVLGLNKAQVGAVASFYTMYKRRPTGDWLVSVCTNTMCNVLGGQEVYDALTEHLGVGHDETTEDGTITLEHAECLAACDYGPVMTVNYDFFDGVDPQRAVGLVDELRAGGRPTPSRGARLCTLKEMSVQLAGFADEREGAVADGVPGEPSLRGLRLAEQHGISVPGFDPNTPIRSGKAGDKPAPATPAKFAPTGTTAPDVPAPDRKSPQVRTAETRQPDAKTAVPDAPGTKVPVDGAAPTSSDARAAEAAGAAANRPAGDAKPAGDDAEAQERNLSEAESSGGGQGSANDKGAQK